MKKGTPRHPPRSSEIIFVVIRFRYTIILVTGNSRPCACARLIKRSPSMVSIAYLELPLYVFLKRHNDVTPLYGIWLSFVLLEPKFWNQNFGTTKWRIFRDVILNCAVYRFSRSKQMCYDPHISKEICWVSATSILQKGCGDHVSVRKRK